MREYIWLNPYTDIDGKQWHAYVTDELPDKKLPRVAPLTEANRPRHSNDLKLQAQRSSDILKCVPHFCST